MLRWKRPSGRTITTNEEKETVEHCESMGWEKLGVVREILEPVVPVDLKPDEHREPLVGGQTSGEIGEGDPGPEIIAPPMSGPRPVKTPKKAKSGKL